jgi:transcriptional antiterminator NusG
MSLEELDNLDTPPVNTVNPVDDFEAALAASTDVPATEVLDVAVVPDETETETEEEENDENAEFRRALRTALGDWYVVHSYAGYEKKVKGNLANRITSLNMED